MPTVPLPPWLRRIQQSFLWQFVGLPIIVGFFGALTVNGCLAHGLFAIDTACLEGATSSTLISFLTVAISGHSPGSDSFKNDGTVNEAVKQTAAITK